MEPWRTWHRACFKAGIKSVAAAERDWAGPKNISGAKPPSSIINTGAARLSLLTQCNLGRRFRTSGEIVGWQFVLPLDLVIKLVLPRVVKCRSGPFGPS
jgi:hypothetical protein